MKISMWQDFRAHWHRYAASLAALTLAVTFVAGALTFTTLTTRASFLEVTQQYRGVDIEVAAASEDAAAAARDIIAADPQITATRLDVNVQAILERDGHQVRRYLRATPAEAFVQPRLAEGGRLPTRRGEIVLDATGAKALHINVSDSLTLTLHNSEDTAPATYTVVGILADETAQARESGYLSVAEVETLTSTLPYAYWSVSYGGLDPGAQDAQAERLTRAFGNDDLTFSAGHHNIDQAANQYRIDATLLVLTLAFPLVAAAVGSFIVAATFRIVWAQRARHTALLRVIGATRRQVMRMARREALTIGLVAATLGTLIGAGVGLAGACATITTVRVAALAAETPWATLALVWVGALALTAIATARPIREAAQRPPLAALTQAAYQAPPKRARRVGLLVLGSISLIAGVALMAWGLALRPTQTGFFMAFCGGFVSLIGVLVVCALALPTLISLLMRPFARGPVAQLACDNIGRNRRATATVGTTILVGLTLIVMTATGAQTATRSAIGAINNRYALDLAVTNDSVTPIVESDVARIAQIPGVDVMVPLTGITLNKATITGGKVNDAYPIVIASLAGLDRATHRPIDTESPEDLLTPFGETPTGLVCPPDSEVVTASTEGCRQFSLSPGSPFNSVYLMDPAMFDTYTRETDQPGHVVTLALKLSEDADPQAVIDAVTSILPGAVIQGAAWQRTDLITQLTILSTIAIGLIGMSVLIAAIGLLSTLSLATIERARENGLLRALGLTRRQVRRLVTLEAAAIGGVCALIGTLLGVSYGIVGSYALPVERLGTIAVKIPWLVIAAVAVGTLVLALLAAWLPGRRASQVDPIAALATD